LPTDEITGFNDEFLTTYQRGTVVEVYISQIIPPSQVITTFTEEFTGRLSLMDIDPCFPIAEQLFAGYAIGKKLVCVITAIDLEIRTVTLSIKDIPRTGEEKLRWEKIHINDEFKIESFEPLNDHYLIKTAAGNYGIIPRLQEHQPDANTSVRVSNKMEASGLLYFLSTSAETEIPELADGVKKTKFNSIEEDLQSYHAFSRSLLSQYANTEQELLINSGFQHDPRIFSNDITLDQPLLIEFQNGTPAYENDFLRRAADFFLPGEEMNKEGMKKLLEKVGGLNYWFKLNKFQKNDDRDKETYVDFTLFNDQVSIFVNVQHPMGEDEPRFIVRNFNIGHDRAGTSERKKKFSKNGAFLFNSAIVLRLPYTNFPLGFSQRAAFNSVMLKSECHHCIAELKKESGEILRQEGHTLGIIDKFLEYQLSLLDKRKENTIFIERYKRVPSESSHAAISFVQPMAEEELDLDGDPVVNVRIRQPSYKENLDEELVWVGDGVLKQTESGWKISFKDEVDVSLLDRGFYIEKRISKRQLHIQREIIKDFLEKKIRIDHIEALLIKPEQTKTPKLARVDFINPDLKKGAESRSDNNQITAVKKAVGNQNIFLIQGPPGTGKTTVIAEIISQLTARKEKILVAGQNHVAVDNVLKKIAKDANLALLRVGNPEKVDPDMVHYCIEKLSEDYKADLKLFIQHQSMLAQEYLVLKQSKLDPEEISTCYKTKANSLAKSYGRLQDRYRNMHLKLQQTLAALEPGHIQNSVKILENWSSNIQSEYELLLEPLIYNSVDVVFATCIGIKTDPMFRQIKKKFDTVIIDEAGKANIAETIVAMELGKKVILVGDQMQLPPYIDGACIDERNPDSFQRTEFGQNYQLADILHALKTSFLEFIINRISKKQFPAENLVLLNYQHRMHPHIGEFVSASFYDGKVQMGADTHLQRLPLPMPLDKEIIFFDTSNTSDRFERSESLSFRNDCEAKVITDQVMPLLLDNEVKPENIAIIAPYKLQVGNIQRFITNAAQISNKQIDVSTLDSFQGKEYDVIIFSFTRSTDHSKAPVIDGRRRFGKVGFLDDARRLNVAFSRAKKKLILIGDAGYLSDPRSHYDFLFNYTGLFKTLVGLTRDPRLGRFINIASYRSDRVKVRQPIDLKVGTIIPGKVGDLAIATSSQKPYGRYILLAEGKAIALFAYKGQVINKNFSSLAPGASVQLLVIENELSGYPVVQILPPEWIEIMEHSASGKPLKAFFECKINGGFLLKLKSGLTGMVSFKDTAGYVNLTNTKAVDVVVKSFDMVNHKIKFKVHHD